MQIKRHHLPKKINHDFRTSCQIVTFRPESKLWNRHALNAKKIEMKRFRAQTQGRWLCGERKRDEVCHDAPQNNERLCEKASEKVQLNQSSQNSS